MIRFLDATGPFLLPTAWHEVSTKQWCAVAALPTPEDPDDPGTAARLAALVGRPVEATWQMQEQLWFLNTDVPTDAGLPFPQDLGQEAYLQVQTLQRLRGTLSLPECFAALYGVFVQPTQERRSFDQERAARRAERCLEYPITETMPAVVHCTKELERLATLYKRLGEPDDTEAGRLAEAAGVEVFDKYNYFNVLKRVAQDYHTTPDTVALWPYDTVATHLLHERDAYEYQQRLHELQKPKAQ